MKKKFYNDKQRHQTIINAQDLPLTQPTTHPLLSVNPAQKTPVASPVTSAPIMVENPQKNKQEPKITITSKKPKLLIVAHNHPHFFPGGAEIIAYDLFKTMREQGNLDVFFMGGVSWEDRKVHTGTPFQTINDKSDEISFLGRGF